MMRAGCLARARAEILNIFSVSGDCRSGGKGFDIAS